ncbi:MAG TPA: diguanylate cyclase [Solirubrobacteraceae bacterium]|nr:diguanylate cyclase [Solirubrobacteraceae bacterium]
MAARDPNPRAQPLPASGPEPLSESALLDRLEEEIGRAERHGTKLSCLLVVLDNVEELVREHGSELPGQTLAYVARALRRELRRFDRIGRPSAGELLIVLPGADGPLGEIVARRVLERLQTIKVEADGTRRPLQISLGLAAWRADMSPVDLLARARAAARRRNGDDPAPPQPHRGAAAAAGAHLARPPLWPSSTVEGAAPS